jgi:glucose-1-phosphate adenylyltransferase
MFAVDQMDQAHRDNRADVTIAAVPVPVAEARAFGVIHVDARGRITGFAEKPRNPPEMPDRPGWSLVSMGNYLFKRDVLEAALAADGEAPESRHDFGKDIIPRLVAQGARAFIYDFAKNRIPGAPEGETPYWRDVGTTDTYFTSNMELRARVPALDLYNRSWRIRTAQRDYPPARFVRAAEDARAAEVSDSLICEGSIISSATLREVVLGYDCFVHAGAIVEESIVLSGCDIGAGSRMRKVILDKNCKVEPGVTIGEDPHADRTRFPFMTESGIVVLPKGSVVPKSGPVILANDVAELIANDPDTAETLRPGTYTVSGLNRHSYDSAGPRFKRYGAPPDAKLSPSFDLIDDEG